MNIDDFDEINETFQRIFRALNLDSIFPEDEIESKDFDITAPEHWRKSEYDFEEPLVDVIVDKKQKEVVVLVELLGTKKEDIKIHAIDGGIEISADRKEETEEAREEQGYIRRERRYSRFYRTIPLPATVDSTKAKATYNNGVLEITLPTEEVAMKTIKVE
ncbi:MAG: Hsp20/alpha crystallin family protein [Candidatus Hydrothermarchaeales archaeon]